MFFKVFYGNEVTTKAVNALSALSTMLKHQHSC